MVAIARTYGSERNCANSLCFGPNVFVVGTHFYHNFVYFNICVVKLNISLLILIVLYSRIMKVFDRFATRNRVTLIDIDVSNAVTIIEK